MLKANQQQTVEAGNDFVRSEDEKEGLLQVVAENTEDFIGAELQNVLKKETFEPGQEDSTEIPEELKLRLAYKEAAVAVIIGVVIEKWLSWSSRLVYMFHISYQTHDYT